MIAVLLRDLRWRILLLALIGLAMYALEPAFHQHGGEALGAGPENAAALGPLGISATLSYLAGLAMIVLLAGFVSTDRREGYTRLFFAHPTRPLALYGLKWALAYLLAVGAAALFLVLGQWFAWGEFRGGWAGMILPLLNALIYGGLVALLSALLPRGDGWIAFLFFLPTFFPQIVTLGLAGAGPGLRQAVLLLLPPQGALQQVYEGLLLGTGAAGAALFAAGYGLAGLAAAAIVLRLREWP